jgi:hypothetical protein
MPGTTTALINHFSAIGQYTKIKPGAKCPGFYNKLE